MWKPANCGPLASLREIFRFERLRGGGDVPLVCDFKQSRCPTALNTHAERKRQFGPLSNLSPNIELRPGRGRIRKIDATRRTVREVRHSRPSDIS
jgi:hypothetical protein